MDSFGGFFLKEDLDETDNGLPSSELKSELDVSVENLLSTQPSSNESRTSQMGFLGHTLLIFQILEK
jgi:hypothetical protein